MTIDLNKLGIIRVEEPAGFFTADYGLVDNVELGDISIAMVPSIVPADANALANAIRAITTSDTKKARSILGPYFDVDLSAPVELEEEIDEHGNLVPVESDQEDVEGTREFQSFTHLSLEFIACVELNLISGKDSQPVTYNFPLSTLRVDPDNFEIPEDGESDGSYYSELTRTFADAYDENYDKIVDFFQKLAVYDKKLVTNSANTMRAAQLTEEMGANPQQEQIMNNINVLAKNIVNRLNKIVKAPEEMEAQIVGEFDSEENVYTGVDFNEIYSYIKTFLPDEDGTKFGYDLLLKFGTFSKTVKSSINPSESDTQDDSDNAYYNEGDSEDENEAEEA